MPKFAHLADCHLGAWRDARLRKLNLDAFEQAMDICVAEKVDFIIISGDLFHSNIPDLDTVKRTVEELKAVRKAGIRIFVVYGSHDYSPNAVSMVDVLASTELFQKVVDVEVAGERLILKPFVDATTGIVIAGLSGRSGELERAYFEVLDTAAIEQQHGFKIFAFHSGVTELKPRDMSYLRGIPLSRLPPGFNYYAGGHVHRRIEAKDGNAVIAFPGPLFGSTFTDLEDTAKGETRGFYVVEYGETMEQLRFVEIQLCKIVYEELLVDKKTARQVNDELKTRVEAINADEAIVLLRVKGTLASGTLSEIDFAHAREVLLDKGAVYVLLNRQALTTATLTQVTVIGENATDTEQRLFKEYIGSFKVDLSLPAAVQTTVTKHLTTDQGVTLARKLFTVLWQERLENEQKTPYQQRVTSEAIHMLPGRTTT